jgi:DNA-binding NarL/FixJ family response regulator
VRVLLVDDHEVIWSGMKGVVERLAAQQRPGAPFEWFCARDLAGALAAAAGALDLILLDYHLPDTDGLAAMRALRERFDSAPIVIVSGDQQPERIRRAIEAGAAGYIPKTMPEAEMVAALGLVMAHGVYLPPVALLDAAPAPEPADDAQLANDAIAAFMAAELSPRQREVFARALRGKPNKVIARELGIAEGTVKVHLAMVFRALGVRNRTEAMYRVLSADAINAVGRL